MLASELPNVVLAQHLALGVFAYLFSHFGGLLKKLLFLGRTLLRLWLLGRHDRLERLGSQPEQLGASKPVPVQECWLQG